MPSKFSNYKTLRSRLRKSFGLDGDLDSSLTLPVSQLIFEYFEKSQLPLAMVYIDRLRKNKSDKFDLYDSSELYITALVLANKFLNDGGNKDFVWNDEWAELLDVSTSELNSLELRLINDLDWNVYVSDDIFEKALNSFEVKAAIRKFLENGDQLTYSNFTKILDELPDTLRKFLKELVKIMIALVIIYVTSLLFFALIVIGIAKLTQIKISPSFECHQTFIDHNDTYNVPIVGNLSHFIDLELAYFAGRNYVFGSDVAYSLVYLV